MRCHQAREDLALLAGGDLPEKKIPPLLAHVDACPDCAAELEALKRAQTFVGKIARADIPDPLPADFSQQVQRRIVDENKPAVIEKRRLRKPAYALAAAAVVLLLGVSVWQSLRKTGEDKIPAPHLTVITRQVTDNGTPAVKWDDVKSKIGPEIGGPYKLADWTPPGQPGVYVVMHRPDPVNAPDSYRFDYWGEAARLIAFRGNPWVHHREKRLVSRAGSKDNIYIAVLLMPESSKRERREIEKNLIEEYNPYFNRKKGV